MANPTGKGGKKFQPGVSGNPGGGKKLDPVVKAFKEASYKDFINHLQVILRMTREEVAKEIQRPDAQMFELLTANIVASAAKGDKDARNVLLERLWGKVKDVHEIQQTRIDDLKDQPTDKLIRLVKASGE